MVESHHRRPGSTLQLSAPSKTSVYFATVANNCYMLEGKWHCQLWNFHKMTKIITENGFHGLPTMLDERCSKCVQKVFKMRPEGLQKAFRMCSRVVQKCVKGVQHGSTCAQNRSAIPSGNFHCGTVPGTKIDHLGNTSFIGCPTVHIFRIMPEKNQHITFLWVKIEVVPQKLDETPNTPWISMG